MLWSRFFGFTFLEVLISLTLLGFAVLGLELIAIVALQQNRHNYYVGIAEQQLLNMRQRLAVFGTNHSMVVLQVGLWNAENQKILPGGNGTLQGIYPSYSVRLCWLEQGLTWVSQLVTKNPCITIKT
jgi:hypothetical protein